MDPTSWLDFSSKLVTIVRDVIAGGAAIVSVWTARQALGAWKLQLAGKEGFDLARKVIATAHEIREADRSLSFHVQRWVQSEQQLHSDPVVDEVDEIGRAIRYHQSAIRDSYAQLDKLIPQLKSHLVDAKILWGKAEQNAIYGFLLPIQLELGLTRGYLYTFGDPDTLPLPAEDPAAFLRESKIHEIAEGYKKREGELDAKLEQLHVVMRKQTHAPA